MKYIILILALSMTISCIQKKPIKITEVSEKPLAEQTISKTNEEPKKLLTEEQYWMGVDAYNKQNYLEAVKYFEPLANAGHASSQYYMGAFYYSNILGQDMELDERLKKAIDWFQRSLEGGDSEALYTLAFMYINGQGLAKDPEKAIELYEAAAFRGDAKSQNALGIIYSLGEYTPVDDKKAIQFFTQAAQQKLPEARYNLAFMHEQGKGGLTKDPIKALEMLEALAEDGYGLAKYAVGYMYYFWEGIPQDPSKALYWLREAVKAGYPEAEEEIKRIEDEQPKELREAGSTDVTTTTPTTETPTTTTPTTVTTDVETTTTPTTGPSKDNTGTPTTVTTDVETTTAPAGSQPTEDLGAEKRVPIHFN